MNITAYAEEVSFNRTGARDYGVIDAAASVGRKYPVVIGHVTIIRGFAHFTGEHFSALRGLKAVIAIDNASMKDTITKALREGIKHGRDDQR
jgi:hypothetical protein